MNKEKPRHMPRSGIAACALLGLCLATQAGAQDFSAKTYAITQWGNCGGGARPQWDDMCFAWWGTMGNIGYGLATPFVEGNVTIEKFASNRPNYQDNVAPWGIDSAAATLVCTHGGNDANGWYGVMHNNLFGECWANSHQLSLGQATGGQLRYWLMSSCNSMRIDYWEQIGDWWAQAALGGVHVTAGFHGYMYIGDGFVQEYVDMAIHGFGMGVGAAWVHNMHHQAFWPWEKTICPVAVGWADSSEYAANRVFHERFQDAWPETPNGTNNQRAWAYFIPGCQPQGDNPLPN